VIHLLCGARSISAAVLALAALTVGCGHLGRRGEVASAPPPWPQVPGPTTWQWPTPRDALAARAVAFARAQLGKPYCWGGTGPTCFDCSGLTYAAWRSAGDSIPRTSELQQAELPNVALGLAQPGDVVWRPGHVGLYVGDGWVIHAPRTGEAVKAEPLGKYDRALKPITGAR
jgi:cell wall-associated NlpC family hydrolase